VQGSGFECFDEDCSDLYCRFGNRPSQYIYVKGQLADSELVRCKVPQYTKPDVLWLEVTINGESYTSDNLTFGFFDPFVLDAAPRLIATDGSTLVDIKGIGFVNSGESKAIFSNRTHPLACGAAPPGQCVKTATYKDKHVLTTPTFPQPDVKYLDDDKSVKWDPVYVDATVLGDEYTENEVELFYYEDPALKGANIVETPGNIQSQLLIGVDFKGNDMGRLMRYATPKCRFTSGSKVVVADGQIIAYPFTGNQDPSLANTVHCKTPRWVTDGTDPEKATLDVSLNGQNYVGALDFTFLRDLVLHRDVPMAGPARHESGVKLLGQGFRMHGRGADVKWGTQMTERIPLSSVQDDTYNQADFLDTVPGAQELRAYQDEAGGGQRVDSQLTDGGSYEMATMPTPLYDDATSQGGPEYVEVGLDEVLTHTEGRSMAEVDTSTTGDTDIPQNDQVQ